jgi:16S rRNA (uracil1498-N3)-methyltransferase
LTPVPESGLAITLIQGISRGERMDFVVQKATELGVSRIVPVRTARSVVRLDAVRGRRRQEHWRAVAASACEQCGRSVLPRVDPPRPLSELLADLRDDPPEGARLMPDAAAPGIGALQPPAAGSVLILIGPEGGLDQEEKAMAARQGFVAVGLGPRVLRTETAALVAVSVCQLLWGDLSASRRAPG